MSKTLLEFKNLVTEFHTEGKVVTAVNNISFTLNRGETIGIVGESGSGKSVTSLSAMLAKPSGRIANGESVSPKDGSVTNSFLKKKCVLLEVMN